MKKIRAGLVATLCMLHAVMGMAAVTVPNTFSNGQVADANDINENFTALADGINQHDNDSHKVIIYSGWCGTDISGVTSAQYCLDSTRLNTATGHLSVEPSGTVTVLKAGIYRVRASIIVSSVGQSYINMLINDANNFISYSQYNGQYTRHIDAIRAFSVGDTIKLKVEGGSNNITTSGMAVYNEFVIQYLGQ